MKDPLREKKKRLRKHAYLEELGLPRRRCGTNFTRRTKIMRREKEKYGFDRRETYDMGDMFAQWLYEHLRMYLDVAGRIIDLDDKLTRIPITMDTGESVRITLRDGVERVLDPLKTYLALSRDWDPDTELEAVHYLHEAARRWAEIVSYVNW